MDLLIDTKYGRWIIKERAIDKVKALADLLHLSINRAVEVIIEQPEFRT